MSASHRPPGVPGGAGDAAPGAGSGRLRGLEDEFSVAAEVIGWMESRFIPMPLVPYVTSRPAAPTKDAEHLLADKGYDSSSRREGRMEPPP